ncbi:mechanosensitive ion channel family protein [Lentilactobacillus laojiaonis]|uniref:mechanosensitive ion channel family protein n=1 Tax=Lentilactobacillus laojiaonis TaxID=2883998 RepID=UPI001D09FE16|nr:mechanosensitive ion channel domain-containing protein [Lentilactobacillus laojiaonis]UDM31692.1 mechanosensitive ion channel family protein [Lentilactobacillus laojiaonis]
MKNFFKSNVNHLIKSIDWQNIFSQIVQKIFIIVILTIGILIIKKIGKIIIDHAYKKYEKKHANDVTDKRIKTFYTLSLNIFQYCMWFLWIYSILTALGFPIGTLVASAGIFSLVIGLGAQGLVNDILGGFFIILEHQIAVGDFVLINGISGTISYIGIRTTQIIGIDGSQNYIPNRLILTISNMSRNNMVAIIQIRVFPESPIEKINSIIKNVNDENISNYKDIIAPPNIIGLISLQDGSLVYQVNITTKNGAQGNVQHKFLALYLDALQKNNISLPNSPIILNQNN